MVKEEVYVTLATRNSKGIIETKKAKVWSLNIDNWGASLTLNAITVVNFQNDRKELNKTLLNEILSSIIADIRLKFRDCMIKHKLMKEGV